MCLVASSQLLTTDKCPLRALCHFLILKVVEPLSKTFKLNFFPCKSRKYFLVKMVDFTEDQIEDIKDGFDLYDRKGSTRTWN